MRPIKDQLSLSNIIFLATLFLYFIESFDCYVDLGFPCSSPQTTFLSLVAKAH